ncbi:hypothetical protein GCM10027566_04680 [Arachidicoccus ginsenosidivorans]
MRQRFEQKTTLRTLPIADANLNFKSRDELPPIFKALQFIFTTPELNENVFEILEKRVFPKAKKKVGRKGMDLWHVLVLAVVRHAMGTDWDKLHYMANSDRYTRSIMGVYQTGFSDDNIEFNYQTILDNVSLLDEETLREINGVVVEAGYSIIKKKEEELRLKTDSYAIEKDVDFPTDLGLLWDSCRKIFDLVESLKEEVSNIKGWRKLKSNYSKLKAQYRATMFQVYKGKTAEKKKASVEDYLKKANELIEKTNGILYNNKLVLNSKAIVILIALRTFRDYAMTFTNQIDRRLLKGETIPSEEKRYSIFEPDTEWLTKGKANNKVELGHLFLVTTDQYQFIVDYKVMYDERDAAQVPSLVERLEKIYPNKDISSISFDKGFYSFENLETLEASKIKKIILPKKGKKNKEEKKKEAEAEFVKLRHKHSAVESNINMLEHHGLGKCMDKGVKGFNRYAGISVLAHNLHILGNLLEKQKQKPTRKRQKPAVREAA